MKNTLYLTGLWEGRTQSFSIEPNELAHLKAATSEAFSTLGEAGYERKKAEASNVVFRRSLYFVESLKAGEKVTSESVRRIRPGYGLAPKYEGEVIGSTLSRNVRSKANLCVTKISKIQHLS